MQQLAGSHTLQNAKQESIDELSRQNINLNGIPDVISSDKVKVFKIITNNSATVS